MVFMAFREMDGSEIFVKKIPSVKILDLAKCLAPKCKIIETGLRPGEKLHEQLISKDESQYTYEFGDYYKILSPLHGWNKSRKRIGEGVAVEEDFYYTSNRNDRWLNQKDLKDWLESIEIEKHL